MWAAQPVLSLTRVVVESVAPSALKVVEVVLLVLKIPVAEFVALKDSKKFR